MKSFLVKGEASVDHITFQGKELQLVSDVITSGPCPDFEVVDTDMKKITPEHFKGKKTLLLTVPSIDTPVCHQEVCHAQRVFDFPKVQVVSISMDLPFALQRFAKEHPSNVLHLSDYKTASFGQAFGVLVKKLHLLARACFILDEDNQIVFSYVVEEMTQEPDYDKIKKELE